MNKTAVKNYAVYAREKLISDIEFKAGLIGITEKGISAPLPQSNNEVQFFDIGTKDYSTIRGNEIAQRNAFVGAINAKEKELGYAAAFHHVVEQAAYTWFNRLAAVRFMEVNDYLPCRMRVLSSETTGKNEPDIVTNPFDSDMEFTDAEREDILEKKDKSENEELFRRLFIKECDALHEMLPGLFAAEGNYIELLLNISYNDENGVVYKLVHDIPEADFNVSDDGQIEIIGWLYQYYNIEAKERVFANLKKNKKIEKEDIPAATQLFTPDWIVRYMVENSLGRLWLEHIKAEREAGTLFIPTNTDDFEVHEESNDAGGNTLFVNSKSGIDDIDKAIEYSYKKDWKYYLDEAEQEESVKAQLAEIRKQYKDIKPEDIRFIDPCMGSGHILVYAFELLMKIYTSVGYTERDAAVSIIQNNLYGLDIDPRARQLAYFAVMMKGRQYNRRIFTSDVVPNVYVTENSANITDDDIEFVANGNAAMEKDMKSLRDDLRYADEFGSLIDVKPVDFDAIFARLDEIEHAEYSDLVSMSEQLRCPDIIVPFVKQAQTMAQKYDVVCTNPPYMAITNANLSLKYYVEKNYTDSKADLFSAFIEKCSFLTNVNGYYSMITQHAWMFLLSFDKLRRKLQFKTTINMAHLGPRAFNEISGEVVQTAAFVKTNAYIKHYHGKYDRLIDGLNEEEKRALFLDDSNSYSTDAEIFTKIPGSPIAYWVSESFISNFAKTHSIGETRKGMVTADNPRFIRSWTEVDIQRIGFGMDRETAKTSSKKWFPYVKGGEFRKWYGNLDWVVNWQNDGAELLNMKNEGYKVGSTNHNLPFIFKPAVCWTKISAIFASRIVDAGFLIDDASPFIYISNNDDRYICLGLYNSPVSQEYLDLLNPTMNFSPGTISNIPYLNCSTHKNIIVDIVKDCISLSKQDWDSFETSWDFKRHPLLNYGISLYSGLGNGDNPPESKMKVIKDENKLVIFESGTPKAYTIESAFDMWSDACNDRFNKLKANEEELNRIFIDIYGLQDELTPEVDDKDVTVRKADLTRDIKSLLSYAVGCMFGRYSLDVDGLAYAGGEWDDSKYRTFIPDKDNCIPITDEAYFEDDIVGLLCGWLKKVYGTETLEENLDFIAAALDCKGNTSRDKIRSYFLTDFIKDHIRIYQKRPIYWLFDSGKQNGFKALVYMHRWNADTVGNVRVEYLHKVQKVYEQEIERMQDTIENSGDSREIARASKRREKLLKQQKEVREYDEKIAHVALSRVDIDLDDGVKVNYEKVQKGKDGKRLEILAAIK